MDISELIAKIQKNLAQLKTNQQLALNRKLKLILKSLGGK